MRGRRCLFAVVLVLGLVLGPSRQSRADDPREVARGYYARGLERARRQDYEGALHEFTQAYQASPHFAVLYNIGQCHVLLGHVPEAVEALSRYLSDGRYLVPAERRQQVGEQVAQLGSRLKSPPVTTVRSLEEAARDAAEAAELAGEAAIRAAKVAHAAAVAARIAAAAVSAARVSAANPKVPAPPPVTAQGTKSGAQPR